MNTARRRAALAAAYLGTFLATLDISIVNVALPTMQTALHTDIAGLQWVVNAYAICLSALMLSAGPAADRHGHKRAWLAGVILFTAGSAVCGLAPNLGILLAGRAIQGVAAALLIAGALPILTHIFPEPKARASAIGGWSAFSALALILGPLLGGLLLDSLGWQSIFLINLPLGLLAVALGAWGIPERRFPDHAARDPWGQALSVIALGALAYGLIQAGETGFLTPLTLLTLGLALAGFVLFILVERRVARPLLPLALFRHTAFVLANNASFMLGFAYYSSLFFFSIYLQQIHGWSPVETGWRMMPQFVVTACLSMLFGRLGMWLSVRTLMLCGYALIAVAMFAMMGCDATTAYGVIGLNLALLGAGAGLAVPATSLVIMGMAPPEQAGSVSATMNALRQAGMTLGIALLGALMSSDATRQLALRAAKAGLPDASALAQQVITQHRFPAGLAAQLADSYTAAMTSGFHLAMLGAGLASLLALAGLLRMRIPAPAQA
ncbi:MFS transporter [Kerstersia similis]|uniref:MFS transporter n=1 Tax=Kerstersia similis TaxID=206505 RepID=UPI0039EF6932